MNQFVDECRREWKRLGVPDRVADEMADELTADLAEGASAEDVLGLDAAEPRSFAARWASERGVVRKRRWRSRMPAAVATLALVPAIAGAVLLILSSPSEKRPLAWPAPVAVRMAQANPPVWVPAVEKTRVVIAAATTEDDDHHTLGSILVIVGLAGLVPLTLYRLRIA